MRRLEVVGRRLEIVGGRLLLDLRLLQFDGRSLSLRAVRAIFLSGRVQLLLSCLNLHGRGLEFQQRVSILLARLRNILLKGFQSIGIQLGDTTVEPVLEGAADLLALLRSIEALAKGRLHVADGLTGLLGHILAEAIHLRENAHMRGPKLATASHDSLLYSLVFF